MTRKRRTTGPREARPTTPTADRVGGRSNAQRRQAASQALAAARGGRGRLWKTLVPVVAALALIGVLIGVKVASGSSAPMSGQAAGLAPASIASQVQSVPTTTLNAVGSGTAGTGSVNALPTKTSGPALTKNGLPRVLFVGANWCPYCAAERWALTVALSRFGTFHHLGTTVSSPSDVFPNTQTLSFHGATFSSSRLAFSGFEIFSNQAEGSGYAPLDKLDPADAKLFDAAGGSFPYVNIGGRYVINGASFNPQLLAGKTRAQIAAALSDPSSPIAKAIDGAANVITAALTSVTGHQPTTVSTAPGVLAAAAKLGG